METQGVQLLLLLLCVVSTCWGQQGNPVYSFITSLLLLVIPMSSV